VDAIGTVLSPPGATHCVAGVMLFCSQTWRRARSFAYQHHTTQNGDVKTLCPTRLPGVVRIATPHPGPSTLRR